MRKIRMTLMIIFGVVVVAIAALAVCIALQPSEFRITRSALIAAPPAAVFRLVNDFHQWGAWSPWAHLDPQMKQTFAGADTGTGAAYTWAGNNQVGEGRMTIMESRADTRIAIKLEFLKPFAATNVAEFIFEPKAGATNVTWSMSGQRNFMFKAVHMVMNMDKMVGGQFEQGLADMKRAAETSSAAQT